MSQKVRKGVALRALRALMETRTVVGFFEERCYERFFGFLHQLNDAVVDWIFVLVQPTVRVVTDLHSAATAHCTVQSLNRNQQYSLLETNCDFNVHDSYIAASLNFCKLL